VIGLLSGSSERSTKKSTTGFGITSNTLWVKL